MVKVDQHGEKPRMFIRETVSKQLDTHGHCWWMWTLHPSMPKAQARTNVCFSCHKSLSAMHPHTPNNSETFQADHAEQWGDRRGGSGGHATRQFVSRECRKCFVHLSVSVYLMCSSCTLRSCDWHMAFLHAVSPAVPLKQWYYEWVQSQCDLFLTEWSGA